MARRDIVRAAQRLARALGAGAVGRRARVVAVDSASGLVRVQRPGQERATGARFRAIGNPSVGDEVLVVGDTVVASSAAVSRVTETVYGGEIGCELGKAHWFNIDELNALQAGEWPWQVWPWNEAVHQLGYVAVTVISQDSRGATAVVPADTVFPPDDSYVLLAHLNQFARMEMYKASPVGVAPQPFVWGSGGVAVVAWLGYELGHLDLLHTYMGVIANMDTPQWIGPLGYVPVSGTYKLELYIETYFLPGTSTPPRKWTKIDVDLQRPDGTWTGLDAPEIVCPGYTDPQLSIEHPQSAILPALWRAPVGPVVLRVQSNLDNRTELRVRLRGYDVDNGTDAPPMMQVRLLGRLTPCPWWRDRFRPGP